LRIFQELRGWSPRAVARALPLDSSMRMGKSRLRASDIAAASPSWISGRSPVILSFFVDEVESMEL
jgi:hypothetical protein